MTPLLLFDALCLRSITVARVMPHYQYTGLTISVLLCIIHHLPTTVLITGTTFNAGLHDNHPVVTVTITTYNRQIIRVHKKVHFIIYYYHGYTAT